ncbi:lysophospholipase [Algivirga pacifica]|uniref:Alpha/beta hydrolase n=1 Tax=Algivirga pacifica TaxID=1162670 RepID=A0ABP9DBH3_9BACT
MNFDFEWQTQDQLTLRGKCWLPGSERPQGLLCLIHGFGEHIGRYEHVAQFFNQHEIGLIGFDQRGHGRSDGKRGVVPSYESLLVNITEFLALTYSKFPEVPLYLYGHSMGGNIATTYLLREQPRIIKAGIITSPWYELTNQPPKLTVSLGKMISNLYPSFTVSSAIIPEDLSSDLTVGKKYMEDPLVHNKMGGTLFTGVSNAGLWILENTDKLVHPLLMMHGKADNVTSQKSSEKFARKAPKGLLKYKAWNGMRHELHNELIKEKALQYILDFLEEVQEPQV